MTADAGDPWEEHASWWQTGFTGGVDAEYEEQILPIAVRHLSGYSPVVDVGAGEGQVARALAASGSTVVGVEPSGRQLQAARARGSGPRYLRGVAEALPLASGRARAAVVCLVLEHLDDAASVIAEIARVLAPRGVLLLLINHPLLQTPGSGWIDDHILEEQYWRVGPYLPEDRTLEEVDKGVRIPFVHRPLSAYVNLMAENHLLVTRMEEPAPPPGFLARAPEYAAAASIPRLLVLRAEKLTDQP